MVTSNKLKMTLQSDGKKILFQIKSGFYDSEIEKKNRNSITIRFEFANENETFFVCEIK